MENQDNMEKKEPGEKKQNKAAGKKRRKGNVMLIKEQRWKTSGHHYRLVLNTQTDSTATHQLKTQN